VTIRNSTISGNTSNGTPPSGSFGGAGGGIYFANGGSLVVENSTVSGNRSTNSAGGGIYFYGTITAGGFAIRNSTISGNSAATNSGGLYIGYLTSAALIQNSTIVNNTVAGAGGGGGIRLFNNSTPVALVSTVVANNTGAGAPDVSGAVTASFSLIRDQTGATITDNGNNLPAGTNPLFATAGLANNGGPTQTIALQPGSPLIDKGSNPATLATDQRGAGFARVGGTAADIGAFEVQSATATAPRVTGTAINAGAAQRSMVTQLSVTFSAVVTFASTPGAAFTLTRSGGGSVSFTAMAATVGGVTVVTLNAFTGAEANAGSLNDGRYTLTALANQITVGGQQLDGNGDGTPGDNFVLGPTALFRLYGDITGNGSVDNADFFQFRTTFGLPSGNPAFLAGFDYNGDGIVDNADFFQFRTRFGTSLP